VRSTAEDNAVDSEGGDEVRASTLQARMFAGLAAFSVIASLVYGLMSHEPAGTTLLLLTGGLTGMCGLYVSWNRPPPTHAAPTANVDRDHQEQWFPHASPWPLAVAVGVVLMGNALRLGLWVILPAGVLLAASLAGFAAQSRHRS
jgi:hypothetical protein